MKKIITPGILFLAMALASACTETEDTDVDEPEQTGEGEPTTPVACCHPDAPRTDDVITNAFDLGRRARDRFDFLRRISSN